MTATRFFKILPFLVLTGISSASPIPDFPFIVADGRVERNVPPTNATVQFTVLAYSKTAEESTNTVQASLTKVITALKAEGVADNMIQAHDLDKTAVRTRNEEVYALTDILGYEVSRQLELKLPDLTNYPKIVRALMAADQVSKVNSTFDTTNRDDVEAELIEEACKKARKKADLLEKGAGMKVGDVYSVSDQGFENIGERFGLAPKSYALGATAEDSKIPLFVPSTITLTANIGILYKLAP